MSPRGRPRLVFPLDPRAARDNALGMWWSYGLSARAYWRVIRMLSGLRGALLEHVADAPRLDDCPFDWSDWVRECATSLDVSGLIPAYYFPPQEGRGKAAVLLMDKAGTPVGFAKVAWTPSSIEKVAREGEVIDTVAAGADRADFRIPRTLATFSGPADSYTVVFEPVPGSARDQVHGWNDQLARASSDLLSVEQRGRRSLHDLDWWPDAVALGGAWAALVNEVEDAGGTLGTAFMHGDLAPWNTRVDAEGVLWLLDWEDHVPSGPRAGDIAHFIIHEAQFVKSQSPEQLLTTLETVWRSCDGTSDVKADLAAALLYWRVRLDKTLIHDTLDGLARAWTGR
ncbi:MAG TPA: hypothetical protein VM600_00415 [Actinomycetota bacterium]|nr:hypothetical protein [Actinomycetota bacterium]